MPKFFSNKLAIISIILLLLSIYLHPMSPWGLSNGHIFTQNYTPGEYGGQPQNWAVVQDRDGLIYLANQGGLLQYDGLAWRKIALPFTTARSLALGADGLIYVGGRNDFGYILPGSNGEQEYHSLLTQIPEEMRDFANIWKAHALKNSVYFKASNFIFQWHTGEKKLKSFYSKELYLRSFVINGQFYVMRKNLGLTSIMKGNMELVPLGERLVNKKVTMLAPFPGEKFLVGTRDLGLFIFDAHGLLPLAGNAQSYLKTHRIYHGIQLIHSPGRYALGTLTGGLVVIDSKGGIVDLIDKSCGLNDDTVRYIYENSGGLLWLALNNGLSRIEYSSPFRFFDQRNGLLGLVTTTVRLGDVVYTGTTRGLFLKELGKGFVQNPDLTQPCYSLLDTPGSLIAACENGLFMVTGTSAHKVFGNPVFVLTRSLKRDAVIWFSARDRLFGLNTLNDSKGVFFHKQEIMNKPGVDICSILEDHGGVLWVGTRARGLFKINDPAGPGQTINHFHLEQGLPQGEINLFRVDGRMVIATSKGLYTYQYQEKKFIPDLLLGKSFAGGGAPVFRISQAKDKLIFFHSANRNYASIPTTGGGRQVCEVPFNRLEAAQVNTIYPDPLDNSVWFATNNGLMKYRKIPNRDYKRDFSTLLRLVKLIDSEVPVFFGKGIGNHLMEFEYKRRNIRFEFAAPFFEDEKSIQFQVFLEGYDKDWSSWTKETRKDYTHLDAGLYRFRVKARNIYGHEGREDSFSFRVHPPFYLTWWAYSLYLLLAMGAIFLLVQWRSRNLIREKQQLEKLVKQRTTEVYDQNILLAEQSEKLKEMDQVKSRFFANISHEFRTPLTLIMGPLEQMLDKPSNKKSPDFIKTALRNARRLLSLINQLLDLSRLESGKMKLKVKQENVVPFLKGIAYSFQSLLEQKGLTMEFQSPSDFIELYFDADKLEKVITNLISNGVKFTPRGGKIQVELKKETKVTDKFPHSYLKLIVSDTGVGIREQQLPYIFDRFYQVPDSPGVDFKHQGTGIGLALVKELTELHYGDVAVGRGKEQGTVFTIRLPLGNSHLSDDEMVHGDYQNIPARENVPVDLELLAGELDLAPNQTLEPASAEGEKESKKTILVVEDNDDVRRFIKSTLEEEDYRVLEAGNGKEGLDLAREAVPDLVVSDVMMPIMDGYELCSAIKRDVLTSHIPVILLTAKASDQSVVEGLETGADDYVTKPFNGKILLTRIKNLIQLRRQLQERIQREMVLQPTEIPVSNLDQKFMEELKEKLDKNLSEPGFGVDKLAQVLYMGRTSLNLKMKALTGESTNQFIQSYRLKRAAQLLKANFGNVTEVAFEVGFSSSSYFTRCFKEKFHQLPLELLPRESE